MWPIVSFNSTVLCNSTVNCVIHNTPSIMRDLPQNMTTNNNLFEDVLLPHEFLSISVGVRYHQVHSIPAVVEFICYKVYQVVQQLGHNPVKSTEKIEEWHFLIWYTGSQIKYSGDTHILMQPSMGTLNSPSSRVVKDSTPYRRQILRCIHFGIGESSPNLFLNMMNLYL